MNIVANLLAFVPQHSVLTPLDVALDEITQKAMQRDARVVRAGQAPAAKAARRHSEVPPVLLDHDVRGDLGRAKQRMRALIDREGFRYAVLESGIRVIPPRRLLLQEDGVRCVAVHLVRGHVHKRRFRTKPPRRLEQVQRASRVRIEVVEWDSGSAIMRGLRGGVDDRGRAEIVNELEDAVPVANIQLVMTEST